MGGSDTLMLGDRAADFPSRFNNGLNSSITITFYWFYYNVLYYFISFCSICFERLDILKATCKAMCIEHTSKM